MPKYVGQPCTSCRNVFKEGDEIVVCPECGSPYHKECYKREGKCINTVLHESGGEWHAEPVITPASTEQTDRVCPNCGTHNSLDAFYCTNCGTSIMSDRPQRPVNNPNPYPDNPYEPIYGTPDKPFINVQSPFVNVRTVSAETAVDSNTVGEYSKYVGMKFYYYIPKFLKFAKGGGNISFNIPAFFFPHIWFFYRKMPLYGVITLILTIITSVPQLIEFAIADLGPNATGFVTSHAFTVLFFLAGILNWIMCIVSGVFGNYLYYKKAKADIENIKANQPDVTKRDMEYHTKGGTSLVLVAVSFGIMFILSAIITSMIMPTP